MVVGIKNHQFLILYWNKNPNGGTIIAVLRTTTKMTKTIIKNQWNSY